MNDITELTVKACNYEHFVRYLTVCLMSRKTWMRNSSAEMFLTSKYTDKHRHVRTFAFSVAVQADGGAQAVAVFTGCKRWTEERVTIARLRFLQLPRVVLDPPDQLTVGDFFQISNALVYSFDEVCVFLKHVFMFLQSLILFVNLQKDRPDVFDHVALVVLWHFLPTAL